MSSAASASCYLCPVERTALSRDSVDGAIRSDGIDIPDDAPGVGSVCAQVAVEPARKNDPWNRRYRGRLRGTATGTLFTTRMRRFPDDVSGGQIQRPKAATPLGVIPKMHRAKRLRTRRFSRNHFEL